LIPVEIKTPAQLALMRAAGLVVARTLAAVGAEARPGMSTLALDQVAASAIRAAGAVPSFLGYQGYPASICTSVNSSVVHEIPSAGRVLADGDLLSVDCGAIVDGWHADAAITLGIGSISGRNVLLLKACEAALTAGVAAARPGGRLGDIGAAVSAAATGYGVVREYTGHGIGTAMHMDPEVPNHGVAGAGSRLRSGMALAIEPMLTLGSPEVRELDDGWTAVTLDGSVAAHFEHTVAITDAGPWILTAEDSPAPAPARYPAPRPLPGSPPPRDCPMAPTGNLSQPETQM
jgi:methionyl aminopeptidase